MRALHALESRVSAQLAALVDDSVLSVKAADATEAVRTLSFASDHACTLSVRSGAGGVLSLRFQSEPGSAFDIELWQTSGESTHTITSCAAEPAIFDEVKAAPTRIVYSLPDGSGSARRYQTEWVLLP